MTRIPKKLREQMAADPYYTVCAVTGDRGGRIEWHHNLIYAGKQVQARFAIIPIKKSLHDAIPGDPALKEHVDWIMLNRATEEELRRYSKVVDLVKYRARLNGMHGVYAEPVPAKDAINY